MILTMYVLLTTALIALPNVVRAADTDRLINRLESVPAAEMHVYRLNDSNGQNMDCLKVFQPRGDQHAGVYYGVYHWMESSGNTFDGQPSAEI